MAYFRCSQGGGKSDYEYLFKNAPLSSHTWVTSTNDSGATISTTGNEIIINKTTSSNARYLYVGTQIDLTDIAYIIVKITQNTYTISNVSTVFAQATMPTSVTSRPTNSVTMPALSEGASPRYVALDVSALTGMMYVGLGTYTGESGGTRTIKASVYAYTTPPF